MTQPSPNSFSPPSRCEPVATHHRDSLGRFFVGLAAEGIDQFFHPHPLTPEAAAERVAYQGQDFYAVLVQEEEVIGYGMLRGWDEGYRIPSLGIAIAGQARGCGHGRRLMEFLRQEAERRAAPSIRLKVYPDNQRAVALYRSLGYRFDGEQEGQLVGHLDLTPSDGSTPPS